MTEFTPKNPDWEATARASFATQPMMTTLGATLDALSPGFARVISTIPEGSRQQHGQGHAGLAFSIADSAMGAAALTLMEAGQEVVSAELKINLMAPQKGVRLVAAGKVLRTGRRLFTVMGDVWAEAEDGSRTHVAVLTGTMVPVGG